MALSRPWLLTRSYGNQRHSEALRGTPRHSVALRGNQPPSAAYPQLRQWCRRRTSPKPCPQRVHAIPSSHTGGASCRADACASASLPNGPSTLAGRARAGGDVTAATTASHCPRPLRPTTVGMRRRARGAYSLSPEGRAPNRPTLTELISPDGPVRLAVCEASAAVEAGAAGAADGPVARADGGGGGGGAIGLPPSPCAASSADEAAAETGRGCCGAAVLAAAADDAAGHDDGDDGDARGGSQGGRGAALPAPAAASVGLSKTVSPSVMEIQ